MKTIIISGVAGYIGSQLALNLLKKNYQIIGIDNFSNSYEKDMSNLHNFKKFKLLKRNINNINYNIFKKKKN